jgi:hypothetical protein
MATAVATIKDECAAGMFLVIAADCWVLVLVSGHVLCVLGEFGWLVVE